MKPQIKNGYRDEWLRCELKNIGVASIDVNCINGDNLLTMYIKKCLGNFEKKNPKNNENN